MTADERREAFFEGLGRTWLADEAFDSVPDCVFFVKDGEGRYVAVNRTLVERCDRKEKSELIGRTAAELFPGPLGESFTEQDLGVLREGTPIRGQLELHLYPNGGQGWCLTWKEPVADRRGETVGLAGISRDLPGRADYPRELEALSAVLRHVDDHLDGALAVKDLADMAGLSTYQLDQRIRSLFGVTAGQYVTRRRIERACHLLERTAEPITFIALDCGYSDQSAFTRQFRQSVGIPPGAYRESKTQGSKSPAAR